jgi:hypothetical protein
LNNAASVEAVVTLVCQFLDEGTKKLSSRLASRFRHGWIVCAPQDVAQSLLRGDKHLHHVGHEFTGVRAEAAAQVALHKSDRRR